MNPQENRNDERRLQELEMELDKDPIPPLTKTPLAQPLQSEKSVLSQVAHWFERLPSAGKVAVVIVSALVGFSILRNVLQLVASVFSLAILGVILYLVYKFFVTPKS